MGGTLRIFPMQKKYSLNSSTFWDVTPYSLVEIYRLLPFFRVVCIRGINLLVVFVLGLLNDPEDGGSTVSPKRR
jgi:hypothetical protein